MDMCVCVYCKSRWLWVVGKCVCVCVKLARFGLSAAQLAVPPFQSLPRHVETLQGAKVLMVRKEREREGGSLSHELYMVRHFKQQPLSTHNNTRLCYSPSYRISRGIGWRGRLMMKTIHVSLTPIHKVTGLFISCCSCHCQMSLHWWEIVLA